MDAEITLKQPHQSQLAPADNKFHVGNGDDGKHYWLTPPALYAALDAEFSFDFDPCPYPLPIGFDGLTCEWGQSNYVNPPFGSIIHQGKKKDPTAWSKKAIAEWRKGKRVVLVYPIDKWVLMLLKAILGEHGHVRNLGDVRWHATEDGSTGKETGRHIACFILEPAVTSAKISELEAKFNSGLTTEQDDEIDNIQIELSRLLSRIEELGRHRSYSTAITKIDEARHWLSDRKHRAP